MNKFKSPIAIGGVVLSDNSNDFYINGSIIQTVEDANYSSTNPALSGIKIGDTIYRLIPQGTMASSDALAIGSSSVASGQDDTVAGHRANNGANGYAAVLVGNGARNTGRRGIVVGNGAANSAENGIVIGKGAVNGVANAVSFDGSGFNRAIQLKDLSKIFFRNAEIQSGYTSFSQYSNGKTLKDYIGGDAILVLTKTITAEDSGIIEMTVDSEGNLFNYDGVYVYVETPASGVIETQFLIVASTTTETSLLYEVSEDGYGISENVSSMAMAFVQKRNGLWVKQSQSGPIDDLKICMTTLCPNVQPTTANEKINFVAVATGDGTNFPINTVIKVYAY